MRSEASDEMSSIICHSQRHAPVGRDCSNLPVNDIGVRLTCFKEATYIIEATFLLTASEVSRGKSEDRGNPSKR